MPNYCSYSKCIKGKKENVEELINIMNADYDYISNKFDGDRHFFRLLEVNINTAEYVDDNIFRATVEGYCAWNIKECMFEDGYYKDFKIEHKEEFRGTTILIESKRLALDIEIYSEEDGDGSRDHYIIKKGILKCNECDECRDWYFSI